MIYKDAANANIKTQTLYKIWEALVSHANYEKVLLDCKITNVSLNNFSYETNKMMQLLLCEEKLYSVLGRLAEHSTFQSPSKRPMTKCFTD